MSSVRSARSDARVAVVTGASSGIGAEVAKALAWRGWRVIGIGRDPSRSRAAETEIRAASSGGQVDMLRADLALLSDAARAAREIIALTDRIDVLVNNAGGMVKEKVLTAEGHESCFASNHLGPFVLTQRLLPTLRRTAARSPRGEVRIINTTSDASEMVPGMDWSDIESVKQFSPGLSYCRAKLANVLFARALAKRLADEGIVAHAVHPGTVDSNFSSYGDAATQARIKTFPSVSPAQGADTLIWLATDEAGAASTGGYFYQRRLRAASAFADDAANADRLWTESEKLAAAVGS